MKKFCALIILSIFFIISEYTVLAYSTSEYSIDIPSNYSKISENSFTDETGKNINIQITQFTGSGWDDPYSEKYLNEIINALYAEIDNYREEIKNTLRENNKNYDAGLTEKEIDDYAKSFKVESIVKKEVTTFSKNNYKGFHVVAKYKMGEISTYTDQYMVGSGKKIYTLTIGCSSIEEVNSKNNKKIVDSFTIYNFQKLEGKKEKLIDKVLVSVLSTLILGGVGALIGKFNSKKKKDNNNENKNLEEKRETIDINTEKSNINFEYKALKDKKEIEKEELNNKEEEKFCTKCGNKIDITWDFCNNCGNKLK